jgi:flagellar biosynthesis protein FliR
MNEPLLIPLRPVLIFVVVLARVGGMVTFAPFWSHQATNARIRAVIAIVLALAITPVVMPKLPTPPSNLVGLAVVVIGELIIGFVLGFVGRLVFSALDMAAHIIGAQMGLSLAATIDPATRAHTTALGTIAQMLGLMFLLAADGHHWLLFATVRSFAGTAPGTFQISATLVDLVIRLSADALAVGVALAAPAIVLLFAVEFMLALVGKAAPQIQVMVLGFPIKIAAGLWLIGASLYFMPGAIRTTLAAMRTGLVRALNAM